MRSSVIFSISAALLSSVVFAAPTVKRDIDPALIPEFGFSAGINPTGTGDCDGALNGADGRPIKIPCFCPPDRAAFIQAVNQNVLAGHAINNTVVSVTFPTDNSPASRITRIQASVVTLQNFRGPGVGCPASSTTFVAQQQSIQTRPPILSRVFKRNVNPDLVPDLGFSAGVNPTGTGDCDGAVNGRDGKPIKVPCSCPPDRQTFIAALNANVQQGRAVNNTVVGISFPSDCSKASQITRLQASLATLQNLEGPGKGCPASSTTLLVQLQALQA